MPISIPPHIVYHWPYTIKPRVPTAEHWKPHTVPMTSTFNSRASVTHAPHHDRTLNPVHELLRIWWSPSWGGGRSARLFCSLRQLIPQRLPGGTNPSLSFPLQMLWTGCLRSAINRIQGVSLSGLQLHHDPCGPDPDHFETIPA